MELLYDIEPCLSSLVTKEEIRLIFVLNVSLISEFLSFFIDPGAVRF